MDKDNEQKPQSSDENKSLPFIISLHSELATLLGKIESNLELEDTPSKSDED